jgi:geranylgeranyl reductase family protein
MANETCDVLIVGGGPAGSSLAWALHRAGMDVVVMDKQGFPRNKVCAGWITPAIVDELQLDTADYASQYVFQPITGFITGLVGEQDDVRSSYSYPVSYGIRRCEFDHYLLARAGARLRLGEGFKRLSRRDGGWLVNDHIHTPLIIGAGGHFCPVAREMGNTLGRAETVVAAQEIEFEMDADQRHACRVIGTDPELYFCPDLKGYGWCFRKGDFLNIGLGREDNQHLSRHVTAFYDFLLARGRIPTSAARFNGHAYLLYTSAHRTYVQDGALLVGDAAGLAYAQSGEGIRPAIESSLMAAEVIVAAGGDYSYERLAPYKQRIEARFGRRGLSPLERLVPLWVKQAVGRRLLANPWFSRNVVLDKWFLHRDQAALALNIAK